MFQHLTHGSEKIERHSMGNGRQISAKPVKLCRLHGWVSNFKWKDHEKCGGGETGASLELPHETKVMRKAA